MWVAFCGENSLHDRVGAWVCSIENELPPFHIAEEDEDYDGGGDDERGAPKRPCPLELGELSSGKNHNGNRISRIGHGEHVSF
jgi:hypothetical protein